LRRQKFFAGPVRRGQTCTHWPATRNLLGRRQKNPAWPTVQSFLAPGQRPSSCPGLQRSCCSQASEQPHTGSRPPRATGTAGPRSLIPVFDHLIPHSDWTPRDCRSRGQFTLVYMGQLAAEARYLGSVPAASLCSRDGSRACRRAVRSTTRRPTRFMSTPETRVCFGTEQGPHQKRR
jgi:hypothetical protein